MLTNDVKRNIDNARNVLVGKIPNPQSQIDQITTALIYKFMYDMDLEAVEQGGRATFLTGELKKYSWDKYFDDSLNADEKFNLYDDALRVFATAKPLPELFRHIFKDSFLPYRDARILRLFLKEINKFQYDHSESLGNGFEYLLSILGSQGDAGQFRTPRNIIDFMVEVIDPKKNETILDPACGTAGFLISSFKHIKKLNSSNFKPNSDLPTFMRKDKRDVHEIEIQENGKYKGDKLTAPQMKKLHENIHGYDISEDMVRLSRVNMYLHHIRQQNIVVYDTLSDTSKWDDDFDIILANPPFMTPKGGIEPHSKFGVQANRSEVLFVDYIAEHLKTKGRGACIVPEGIIFQSGKAYKQLRKNLVDGNVLYAVVSLPSGVFKPYSGVKTSILFFDKKLAKTKDEILFVKVEQDGFDLGDKRAAINKNDLGEAYYALKAFEGKPISKTSELCKHINLNRVGKISHAVKKAVLAGEGEYNLSGDRYKEAVDLSNAKWDIVELGSVCEIISGQSPQGKYYNETGDGMPFYQGKTEFTNIVLGPPRVWTTQITREAEAGDIVMSVRAPVGPVNIVSQKICIGRGLAAIRANSGQIHPLYLFNILKNMENRIKGSGGAAFDSISRKDIEKIEIPLPSLDVQEKIVTELQGYQSIIDGAMQVVNHWKPQIQINPDWPVVLLGDICNNLDGKRVPITKSEREGGEIPYYGASGIVDYVKDYLFDEDLLLVSEDGANLLARSTPIAFSVSGKCWVNNHAHVLNFESKTTQKFVEIYLNSIDLKEYVTGSAQPKLNQANLNRIKIPLPLQDEQSFIVEQIESEKTIVEANKKLATVYQEKIQAKITELWG